MHLIQRGHDRRPIFTSSRDRQVAYGYIVDAAGIYKVDLHAYVLMDNHVHLLAVGRERGALSRFMWDWSRRYGLYFNRTRKRCGTLYDGRFRSFNVHHESYFLSCMRYIELNPVRARICSHPAKFAWSSYAENSRGEPRPPLSAHPTYIALGTDRAERSSAYKALLTTPMSREEIEFFRAGIRPRPKGRPRRQ